MTPSFSALADNAQYAAVVESRDTIDGKMVLGRTERVTFPDIEGLKGVGMPAKIDTGADSTSLHAENIHLTSTDPRFKDIEGEDLIKLSLTLTMRCIPPNCGIVPTKTISGCTSRWCTLTPESASRCNGHCTV